MSDSLMQTYARLPVAFQRGEGPWLIDADQQRYLDALSGIAVCNLGHAHPAVASALADQARQLLHTSNLYRLPVQEALAQRLCALTGMDAAFFGNSGAEANEAAIKLARLHAHRRGIASPVIVVADNAFHGRTLATLTATGNRNAQAGFEPLVAGFLRVPYNDLEKLQGLAGSRSDIAAVLIEPIQGEGGVVPARNDYLLGVRELCDRHGWLMMLDEVQTGVGRTGRFLASQHAGVSADVVTLAKALGNGVPIGACLARGEAASTFRPGSHGSTFGGNPLAARAALAVLETLQGEALTERAASLGERLLARLRDGLAGRDGVVDVRGRGLMLGVELDRPCAELVSRALEYRLLINVTAQRVIRLLPPLILTDAQADRIGDTVVELVTGFLANPATGTDAH
jgi:acetylornithine aminotransferase